MEEIKDKRDDEKKRDEKSKKKESRKIQMAVVTLHL
jgi:hypothetical protein